MDFFEAQDQARSKTKRLVLLFIVATLAMSFAIYLGISGLLFYNSREATQSVALWDWQRLGIVTLATCAIVGISSGIKISMLNSGGGAIAKMLGGQKVPADTRDPNLVKYRNVVEEMAIASGTRIPEIYLLPDEPSINAFAAGYTQDNAAIAVSRGCIEKLDRDELQGVVAHEFSHILNGDMRLNTRLIGVLFGILVIAVIGRIVLRATAFSGGRRARRDGKSGGGAMAILLVALLIMIVGYVGVFFGRMIQSAISRQREYLADAAAVQFTRNPGGIANALRKIGSVKRGSRIEHPDALETGHLFFANALKSGLGGIFATHPPLKKRIEAIDPSGQTRKAEKPTPEPVPQPKARPAKSVASTIGAADAQATQSAHSLLASLPEQLATQARNPQMANTLLLACLAQEGAQAEVRSLRPEQTQALIELALSSLKDLPEEELQSAYQEIKQAAHADGVITFDEQCLLIAVERNLSSFNTNGKAPQLAMGEVRGDIERLLSRVTQLSGEKAAPHAFAKGATAFNRFGAVLNPKFSDAQDREALNQSLQRLSQSLLPLRKATIHAASLIVAHDDEVEPRELAMLRSLCAALDIPMPQLS